MKKALVLSVFCILYMMSAVFAERGVSLEFLSTIT